MVRGAKDPPNRIAPSAPSPGGPTVGLAAGAKAKQNGEGEVEHSAAQAQHIRVQHLSSLTTCGLEFKGDRLLAGRQNRNPKWNSVAP